MQLAGTSIPQDFKGIVAEISELSALGFCCRRKNLTGPKLWTSGIEAASLQPLSPTEQGAESLQVSALLMYGCFWFLLVLLRFHRLPKGKS